MSEFDAAWEKWAEESLSAQLEFVEQRLQRCLKLLVTGLPSASDLGLAGEYLPRVWDLLEQVQACLAARIADHIQVARQQGVGHAAA
ncbi:hypothetical protein J7L84_00600 [Candidatus Bipolaricaulota bacterium]|nr:hypothetical protein [Candidatus Bipolaricaulota bacterium]